MAAAIIFAAGMAVVVVRKIPITRSGAAVAAGVAVLAGPAVQMI